MSNTPSHSGEMPPPRSTTPRVRNTAQSQSSPPETPPNQVINVEKSLSIQTSSSKPSQGSAGGTFMFTYESPKHGVKRTLSQAQLSEASSEAQSDRDANIERMRKDLKGFMTTDYFFQVVQVLKSELEAHYCQRGLEEQKFIQGGRTKDEWTLDPRYHDLEVEEKAYRRLIDAFQAQADRTAKIDACNPLFRAFFHSFITSRRGFHLAVPDAERDGSAQSNLRVQFEAMSQKPDETIRVWCPVTHRYLHRGGMTLAHIFPVKHGQLTMRLIFGNQADLMAKENLMLMSSPLESSFDKGAWTVVPSVKDLQDKDEIRAWRSTNPKKYRVFVVDPNDRTMKSTRDYTDSNETWGEFIKDRELHFVTSVQPRARYFAFHHLYAVLRHFYASGVGGGRDTRREKVEPCLGREAWVTPGRYLKKGLFLKWMAQIGYVHDDSIFDRGEALGNDDSDMEGEEDEEDEANVADVGIQVMDTDIAHGGRVCSDLFRDMDSEDEDF